MILILQKNQINLINFLEEKISPYILYLKNYLRKNEIDKMKVIIMYND